MDIRGVSYGDVERIIAQVSRDTYDGNVISDSGARALLSGGRGFRGRLRVKDSRGAGARMSATGRHGPYACWHAYRDVFAAIFAEYPDARVRTGMARYDGREGFEANYPATAYINIGSQLDPVHMPDLCLCGGSVPARELERGSIIDRIDAQIEAWQSYGDAYTFVGADMSTAPSVR